MLSFAFTFFEQIVGRVLPETYSSSPLRIDSSRPHHRYIFQLFGCYSITRATQGKCIYGGGGGIRTRVYANFDPVSTVSISIYDSSTYF